MHDTPQITGRGRPAGRAARESQRRHAGTTGRNKRRICRQPRHLRTVGLGPPSTMRDDAGTKVLPAPVVGGLHPRLPRLASVVGKNP